jgi:nitrogen fixation protein NifX
MKVAFTSSTGAIIDGNFCKASSFSVWDIGPREAYYVTTVVIGTGAGNEDDRIAARAEALKECTIVYAMQINGPAAAKLVTRNIHPMKTGESIAVEEIIGRLQHVMRGSPAPWIRKAQIKDVYAHNCDNDLNGDCRVGSILDVTLADILSRYPETTGLLFGSGLALFADEQSLVTNGGLMLVREALEIRGISPDLFQSLLEKAIAERQSPLAA